MGEKNQVLARPQRRKRKFDISSPVGIIVGFIIVIAAIMLGGGGIKAFKNFFRCFIYFNCHRGNNSDNCCGISIWRNKKIYEKHFYCFT